MEQTMTADEQLRLEALDRAVNYHALLTPHIGSADDVIASAARFEKYLKGNGAVAPS